jgi:hypothetical protein
MQHIIPLAVCGGVFASLFGAVTQAESETRPATTQYELKITNITKDQVFSPPVVAVHNEAVALFQVGQLASDELALMAEDGAGLPLADLLSTLPEVFTAEATSQPLLPGETMVYTITGRPGFRLLSAVGMLVNTNDTFFAIDSVRLPLIRQAEDIHYAVAYDAGSETNNEDCAFVPGRACPLGSGNARATDDAEGYVYISNGVHGIADLAADAYDWHNPVAVIGLKRIR